MCKMSVCRLGRLLLVCALGAWALGAGAAEKGDKAMEQVLAKMREEAKKGNPEAQRRLGNAYFNGQWGAPRDYKEAVYWYNAAAQQDDAVAYFNLAVCYEQGLGVEKDGDKAIELYRKAADRGVQEAQRNVAFTLRDSRRQYVEAAKYFLMAADNGDTICQREYGRMLLQGTGLPADPAKATQFLDTAAQKGDLQAQLLAADVYSGKFAGIPQDTQKLVDYLWQAASANADTTESALLVGQAMARIGYCYQEGIGLPHDDALARKWYQKAVDAGIPEAMVQLGQYYAKGLGVAVDPKQAFGLYLKASELGNAMGHFNVGVAYALGKGVAPNDRQAFQYFEKAAKEGLARAQFNLAVFYEKGRGVKADPALAFLWYKEAAGQNDVEALTSLGYCYLEGVGTDADRGLARKYLNQAAKMGSEPARDLLQTEFKDDAPK